MLQSLFRPHSPQVHRFGRKTAGGFCAVALAAALTCTAAPAALADEGSFQVAFQANTSDLWTTGIDSSAATSLAMMVALGRGPPSPEKPGVPTEPNWLALPATV